MLQQYEEIYRKLQQLGKLQRVHGGAMLKENRMVEANLTEKLATNLDERK